ncbi:MAG: hypothetical protein IKW30_06685 [Lachnospiraceae bacterium]|nr:hypothetical protein [Lachnospiraceae bacterium]
MINNVINMIIKNKEWLFSGIGVTIFLSIANFFRRKHKKSTEEKIIKINQKNTGTNSPQIGIQNNYYKGERSD